MMHDEEVIDDLLDRIEALKAERDALRDALKSLLDYEPNCCVCGDETCSRPIEVWAMARAALAREVQL